MSYNPTWDELKYWYANYVFIQSPVHVYNKRSSNIQFIQLSFCILSAKLPCEIYQVHNIILQGYNIILQHYSETIQHYIATLQQYIILKQYSETIQHYSETIQHIATIYCKIKQGCKCTFSHRKTGVSLESHTDLTSRGNMGRDPALC